VVVNDAMSITTQVWWSFKLGYPNWWRLPLHLISLQVEKTSSKEITCVYYSMCKIFSVLATHPKLESP